MPSIRPQRAVSHWCDGTERGPLKDELASEHAGRKHRPWVCAFVAAHAAEVSLALRVVLRSPLVQAEAAPEWPSSHQPSLLAENQVAQVWPAASEPRARQMRKKSDDTPDPPLGARSCLKVGRRSLNR